jgi:hypothetical protein
MTAVTLDRRFANYRNGVATRPHDGTVEGEAGHPIERPTACMSEGAQATTPGWALGRPSRIGAERLAATLDGELIRTDRGTFVRLEAPSTILPLDRARLADLPGQPPPGVPLLCLDTETTGLATAAGTLAFLVGLGWWEGSRFRQVQLLLPDHADEPALLAELARHVPAGGWLVTYNGRGFDWPLIVARYRLARSAPPVPLGHLDLLPLVRRLFRHRMADARLATVESALLDVHRHADVAGWEIPERYFTFLRDSDPGPLVDVVRHNDEDVRSLARLLVHLDRDYADRSRWSDAPAGDLAGLARAFARVGRHRDALACLDTGLTSLEAIARRASRPEGTATRGDRAPSETVPWWSARSRPDYGGRPDRYARPDAWPAADPVRHDASWSVSRIATERARVLRRLGRDREAEAAWIALTSHGGTLAVLAWLEVAKVREHRLADLDGALDATLRSIRAIERQRGLGRPLPRLERAAARRCLRLRRRLAGGGRRGPDLRRSQAGPRRVARRSTDSRSGTPNSPGASTDSEPAAAASRRSSMPPRGPPNRRGSMRPARSVARNTSPAPVGSTTASARMARYARQRRRPLGWPGEPTKPPRSASVKRIAPSFPR